MNGTLKRLFVASATIISLSAALVMSGGAQAKSHATTGYWDNAFPLERNNVSPADPDASIQGQGL